MKIQNIIILAGGDSTRFWPLSEKNIFQFLNKPFISYQIEKVLEFAEKIIVVCNKNNEQIIQKLHPYVKTVLQDNVNDGMAGALLSCKPFIQGNVLVLNAADFLNYDFISQYIEKLKSNSYQSIFLLKKLTEYFPGAYVVMENNKIVRFIEKPDPDKLPSDMSKLVADYFSDFSQLIEIIEQTKTSSDDRYELAVNEYIHKYPLSDKVIYDDFWLVLKYPWHVLLVMKYFLSLLRANGISPETILPKDVVLVGLVKIGKNVKINNFVKIVGPCYIGDNTIIGDHVLIRESHIGRNCLIGQGSEIARSYIDNGSMFHRNYVGDSVISQKVLMGSGAVTANFRFDEKPVISYVQDKKINSNLHKFGAIIGNNSKIGVNSTVLPGIKIGKDSCIAPGEVVSLDIPDKSFFIKSVMKKNIL
ncbi:MAG: sugar phosphate nucleotidyltransferase [bacterium]|nr:sugar phosphate nucleotidyltransferase [bacterium]